MPLRTLFEFRAPTRLIHGPGAAAQLPAHLPPGQKLLLVTDKGLVEAGVAARVAAHLEAAGIEHVLFEGVVGNPPARCVHAGHRLYQREKCRTLLALGGGSSMDVAKMIGVLAAQGGRIQDYLGAGKVEKEIPPLFCLPTTYGTASEVTPFAVLTNPRTRNKDPVISDRIIPRLGLLDPELCQALPAAVGGATGMDALTHAIESYINLLATPLTEGIALSAVRLIGENLRLACANDHETAATEKMLLASTLAGIAFMQTRLGNVHAMSHPVGAQFGVHHGLANAVILPYVMEFNLPARPEKFAAIAAALGARTGGLSPGEAAQAAVDAVRRLNRDLGIPDTLGPLGVEAGGIRALARATMRSGNVAVNPRRTSERDIEALFRKAI